MMIETVNQKNQPKNVEAKDFFSLQKNNESRISFHGNIDLLCPELQSLNISFCNLLKIPEFIFTLMNLTELNLSNNCLTSLPNEIGNLHNLSILNLSRNKLTSLPTSVKCMHNLNSLDASYNYFSEVPDVLYIGLGLLKILDLSFNEICNFDSAPKCINTLKALNLSYNMLKGLPKWIFFVLCQLIVLDVSGNCIYLDFQVNDFYTARVFQSLQFLNIENCQLSFEKCKFLSHFKNLEVLYIGNKTKKNKVNLNYLGNIQMNALKNLKTLKCLYLQNVHISSLDSGLNYLEKLEVLDLSRNLLSWLPECLCDLTSLKVLNLMSNELIFLPTNIGKLINLQELHLGNNNLYYLPEGIYNLNNLNNLEYVDLYNNKLEDINFVIFKKKKLKGIDLESNCLVHKFSVLDIDIKLQYESLKNSLRKHFGFVNSRCDLQIMKSSSENESSIEHNSSWSSHSETITDDEDIVVAVSEKHCQEEFEKEDWENEIVDVKENDYFNPNEVHFISQKLIDFKDDWNFRFRNNYCPAHNHKYSVRETYAENIVKSTLKHKSVEGQFDSD